MAYQEGVLANLKGLADEQATAHRQRKKDLDDIFKEVVKYICGNVHSWS